MDWMMDWTHDELQRNNQSDLEQGSVAWHQFRSKGIGSSDMPVLMEVSPWSDVYTLWLDKTGQLPEEMKFKGNWATERGSRLEPVAREKYEKMVGNLFPAETMIHKEYDFFRASFDGINHELKKVIEIKCPGKDSHQKALMGEVPAVYYPQVQWLMLVSGYDDLDYISWDGDSSDIVVVPVKANKEYQEKLKEKALWFWNLVQTKTPPPVKEKRIIESERLKFLLEERQRISDEIDALNISYDMLTEEMKSIVVYGEAECAGYKLQFIDTLGSIQYNQIEVLKTINLDSYRKPSYKKFDVRKIKSKR